MNLKHLTDVTLHSETKRWNGQVNRALTILLHHLMENDRRRLYSAHKCSSLHVYAQRELKLTEDEATRRIDAMKLLRELPEIESKIMSGDLSMTNMLLARVLFSKEKKAGKPYSKEQKRELLSQFENKSTREAKKIAVAINPEMNSKKSNLSLENIEDESLKATFTELFGMYAHSHPGMGLEQLLHKMCDEQIALERHRKLRNGQKQKAKDQAGDKRSEPNFAERENRSSAAPRMTNENQEAPPKAEIRRQIWARDENKCTQCKSTYAIQEDHRIPESMGGEYTLENIRLRCRSCNQRAAIEFFGFELRNIRQSASILRRRGSRPQIPFPKWKQNLQTQPTLTSSQIP